LTQTLELTMMSKSTSFVKPLVMLEKGYEERSAGMPYLSVDPFWFGMRSDPRYADRCAGWDCRSPSDLRLVRRYIGLTSACPRNYKHKEVYRGCVDPRLSTPVSSAIGSTA
jgi:hypothetical protein